MGDSEGIWEFYKEILGWDLDSIQYTIQLPQTKCRDICALIQKLFKKPIVALNQFGKLAGKL